MKAVHLLCSSWQFYICALQKTVIQKVSRPCFVIHSSIMINFLSRSLIFNSIWLETLWKVETLIFQTSVMRNKDEQFEKRSTNHFLDNRFSPDLLVSGSFFSLDLKQSRIGLITALECRKVYFILENSFKLECCVIHFSWCPLCFTVNPIFWGVVCYLPA